MGAKATWRRRVGLTRTAPAPRDGPACRVSVLDAEEMQRPRRRSLTRGWLTCSRLRELRLLEPSRCRDLLDLNEEIRPDHEVFGLLLGEPENPENTLPLRRRDLESYFCVSPRFEYMLRAEKAGRSRGDRIG